MTGCVNIADFRCRAEVRTFHASPRSAKRSHSLTVVESNSKSAAASSAVFDIGIAREAQRMRHRVVFRPISIQRRAKIIRFSGPSLHTGQPSVEFNRAASWSGRIEGPCDLPPAA